MKTLSSAAAGERLYADADTERVAPTGILGLDQVLSGGLPRDRSVLVVGGAGSGKTLLATEFLVRGAEEFSENGVLVSFEESKDDLARNAESFGWNLSGLVAQDKLRLLSINLQEGAPGVETGEFDLDALLVRIQSNIRKVGAKRLVLDGLNNLLSSFGNERIVRAEILRLFSTLKSEGLTIVATGERGTESWSRLGFEEYLADGLIVLDHRVEGKFAKRILRVVKCRGIAHLTDEFPFLLEPNGFGIYPIDAVALDYEAPEEVVSSGNEGLDSLLEPGGFYKGSVTLVGGASGTGKSSLGAHFAEAACRRKERALLITFEESADQIVRNMASIGIDLLPHIRSGALLIDAKRPQTDTTEGHLMQIMAKVEAHDPSVVVLDPISGLLPVGGDSEVKNALVRMIDFFRSRGITSLLTNLAAGGVSGEAADLAISSLADNWILVRQFEQNMERFHVLQLLKARGMRHAKGLCEFQFTSQGVAISEAYVGLDGVVLGSSKDAAAAKDAMRLKSRRSGLDTKRARLEAKKTALKTEVESVRAQYDAEIAALEASIDEESEALSAHETAIREMAQRRSI